MIFNGYSWAILIVLSVEAESTSKTSFLGKADVDSITDSIHLAMFRSSFFVIITTDNNS